MGFMQNIINRRKISIAVSQKKRGDSFYVILTGVLLFCCLLDMTLSIVRNVVLTCWFWKFTTKKLHYLNKTERSCVQDNTWSTFFLYSQIVQFPGTKTNNHIKQRHGEASTFALLLCHSLFQIYYTPFLTFWEISYKAKKAETLEKSRNFGVVCGTPCENRTHN